jgi:hypothetical protein
MALFSKKLAPFSLSGILKSEHRQQVAKQYVARVTERPTGTKTDLNYM